jgi:hypothetical protein
MNDRITLPLWEPVQAHKALQTAWMHAKSMLLAGHRLVLEIKPEPKSREQEKKYHAQIRDIARQYVHAGRRWDEEDLKRLLVDAFREETKNDPELRDEWAALGDLRLAPAIGRDGFVALGYQTRKFTKKLGSAFIEWLYAFGAENGIEWTGEAA